MIITGLFVIIPFFFMDLKNGDKVELQAYRQRYNSLTLLAAKKGCVISDKGNGPVLESDRKGKIVGYKAFIKEGSDTPIIEPVYEATNSTK